MSRRPVVPQAQRGWRATQRMAPGGRLYSESPVVPTRQRVLFAGEAEDIPIDPLPSDVRLTRANVHFTQNGSWPWSASSYDAGDQYAAAPTLAYPGQTIGETPFDADYWRAQPGVRVMLSAVTPGQRPRDLYTLTGVETSPTGVQRPVTWLASPFGSGTGFNAMHAGPFVDTSTPYADAELAGETTYTATLTPAGGGDPISATVATARVFVPNRSVSGLSGMTLDTSQTTYIRTVPTADPYTMPATYPGPGSVEWGTFWVNDVDTTVSTSTGHATPSLVQTAGTNTASMRFGFWWRWTSAYGARHVLFQDPLRYTYRWDPGVTFPSFPPDSLTDAQIGAQLRATLGAQLTFGWENAQNQYYLRLVTDPLP